MSLTVCEQACFRCVGLSSGPVLLEQSFPLLLSLQLGIVCLRPSCGSDSTRPVPGTVIPTSHIRSWNVQAQPRLQSQLALISANHRRSSDMPAWSRAPQLLSETAALSAGADTCPQLPHTTVRQAYYGSVQQHMTLEVREWTGQAATFMAKQPPNRMDNTQLSSDTHPLLRDKANYLLLTGAWELSSGLVFPRTASLQSYSGRHSCSDLLTAVLATCALTPTRP